MYTQRDTKHENQDSSCNLYITSDATYVIPSDLSYFKILLSCCPVVSANNSSLYYKTRLEAQVYRVCLQQAHKVRLLFPPTKMLHI
jgi:hypothetical protein